MAQPQTEQVNTSPFSPDAQPAGNRRTRQEFFIPIRKSDLLELLPEYYALEEHDQEQFHQLCVLLDALLRYLHHEQLDSLLNIYDHLDPDYTKLHVSEDTLRNSLTDQFFEELRSLQKRANYVQLNQDEIKSAIEAASQLGLRLQVDFDVFDRLEVYARGHAVETWTRRSWLNLFREVQFEVEVFRRLIIAFRLREHPRLKKTKENIGFVYVKTFKNIPFSDLEVLLPGTTVKMSLMDSSRLILPTVTGVAINLFKAWRTVMLITVFASVYKFIGWLGLLLAIGAYLLKLVFGYLRTHDKYQLSLTKHLYFQNLDNNRGGLYRILNEAEEQEFRETAIAYFTLWRKGGADGLTSRQVDRLCEQLVRDVADADIDFEIDDALEKLSELQIASCDEKQRWKVLEPQVAMQRLDKTWDEIFPYHQPHNS